MISPPRGATPITFKILQILHPYGVQIDEDRVLGELYLIESSRRDEISVTQLKLFNSDP